MLGRLIIVSVLIGNCFGAIASKGNVISSHIEIGDTTDVMPIERPQSPLFISDERVTVKKKKKKTVDIEGKVYTQDGNLLPGAYVAAFEGKKVKGKPTRETIVGANGKFKITLPLEKNYIVEVMYPGYYPKMVEFSAKTFDKGTEERWSAKFNFEMIDTLVGKDSLKSISKPVAKIIYYGNRYGFGYDDDYTNKAQEELRKELALAKEGVVEVKKEPVKKEAVPPALDIPALESPVNKYPDGLTEEVIFETRRTIKRTVVKDTKNSLENVYQMVKYAWGGVFYFKNNQSITQNTYDTEIASARGERTPNK